MLAAVITTEVPIQTQDVLAGRVDFMVGARPHRYATAGLHALQFMCARAKRLVEHIRLADTEPIIEVHAPLDKCRGLFRSDVLGELAADIGCHQTNPVFA